jgi:hypothetical protein
MVMGMLIVFMKPLTAIFEMPLLQKKALEQSQRKRLILLACHRPIC